MPEKGKKRKNDDDSSQEDRQARGIKHRRVFRKKGVLTDITFLVGPASIPLKAHKLIMALASPVFEAMFFGPMAEKGDQLTVPDIFPDGFDHMLRFIYGERVCFKSEMAAFQTWIAGDKYYLNELKDKCETYLNECALKPSNIWLMLENSIFLNHIPLKKKCLKYLKANIQSNLGLPGFLNTSTDTLKEVLSMNRPGITVLELLRALLRWAKCKVENAEAKSALEALTPLVKHIRFGAMSINDFSMLMSETGNLITPQDAVSIFYASHQSK